MEGLSSGSPGKLEQLKSIMWKHGLAVLCLQEVHVGGSPYFFSDDFLVIYSGGPVDKRECAGVGFIVAPWVRKGVVGFVQESNRLASLRLRIAGGNLCLVSAYAPQSGYAMEDRA